MPHYGDEDMGAIHKAASVGNRFPFLRSSRVGVMDSPTSPGSSGLGARMPHYGDEDMGAIHKAASVGNLWREIELQVEKTQRVPSKRNAKRPTPRHIIIKMPMAKDKEDLKAARENQLVTYKGIPAIQNEQEECAAILLDHGADPNKMDIHGNTPLHYAVLGQNTAIVEKLLSCMANMEAKNKDDFTPLSLAKSENKEKMVEILLTRGSKDHPMEGHTLKVACYQGHKRVVSQLARRRRLLDLCDTDNKTALIHAIEYEQEECAAILLEHGADPNVVDIHGNTALHYAVLSQNTTIAEKLVSCMANLEVRNKVEEEVEEKSSKREVSENVHDGANDDSERSGLQQQIISEQTDSQQPNVKINENAAFLVDKVEEEVEEKRSKREVSENVHDGANDDSDRSGLQQQINSEQTDSQQPNDTINENKAFLVDKVEEQQKKTSSKREVSGNMHDGAEDNSDSVGVRPKGNLEQSEKQQVPIKENVNTDRGGPQATEKETCLETNSRVHTTKKSVFKRLAIKSRYYFFISDWVEEEEEEKSSKREVSRGMYDGADDDSDDDGLSQHSNREQTDNQQPKDDINEDAVILMNTIEEQEKMTSSKREVSGNMHDGAEDNSDSVGVRQKGNMEQSEKQQVPIKEKENSHRNMGRSTMPSSLRTMDLCVSCLVKLIGTIFLTIRVEEKNKQANSKRDVSENMYDGANDDNDRSGLRQQINSEQTDSQLPNDKINENTAFLVDKVKEKKKTKSRKREESANMYDGAGGDSNNDGLSQHSNREQTDNQQPNDTINENAVILMNKVEEQEKKTSSKREVSGNMHDGAEDNSDSVGVRKKGNMEQSEKKQVPIKENVNTDRHGFPLWSCGLYSKRRIAVACPTSDNVVFKVEGEKKQRSSIKEVSGNISDGADDDSDRNGLRHQGNSQETDTQQSNDKINENTVYLMNKVEEKKEQKNSKREESGNMCDGANDDTDRAGGRQISKSEQSHKHQFPIVENDDSERLISLEEEEKRQKADLLSKKNTGQTRKKEKQSIKNVEMSPKVENTTRTQVMALKTVRRNKVSDSDEKEQRLLRENRRLKNKIAKLTLELDTVKNQNPEMEGKNDSVDIVTVKEKIDHLQKTITETLFQPNAQLEVLRAELTMLSSKLEDEQQNRRRLEAEGDSHRSRRATVVQDHEHCQTSKGDLQVDFKKEKEELICSQDKNKSDMSNLKRDIMEIFSQEFSILKNKVNRLEIELHHTRDALRERAVVLEDGERDQSQTQCQKKEIENVSQKEQGKVNADIGKQESLQERLSHLQRENKLLQQQLERAHYKSEKKGETVIRIQDQIVDTIKILPANSKKQGLRLNETCEELIHECHLLKESRLQYENDKAESDAVVRQLQGELADTQRKLRQLQGELVDTQRKLRQLQGELADTQRKLSMTEDSLKVEPHHCMCSEYQIQELQKELDESRSQCQRQKEELKKYIDLNISLQQSLHEEIKKKRDLEKPMARFQEPLNISKRNLNKEFSFDRDLNPSLIEMKMKTDRLIQETEEFIAASTCNHSPEDNTDQLEEEMKELQKKCDQMTSRRASWKQEIIRVQRQREINRAKHLQELQRLDKIGECARPDIAYRREQVRQFYQDFFPL
ncbi:ankyrin repeat domain-containing protein 26-like [Myotis yumanensis]|uniref:ankyrin repeat domain-containing protein 26-like n=1 Tax=Myotis yumanensis TaxID=159337 RepID=UPI0038D15E27